MSVVTAALRELIALGVQGDALLAAVARIEQAALEERASTVQEAVEIASKRADDELATRKAKAAERTRKWREKNKPRDAGDETSVTVTSPDVECITVTNEPSPAPRTYAQVVNPTSSLRSEDIPPTPPSEASPKGVARSKSKDRRSRFVPEDWNPTEADAAYAAGLGFTPGEIERELAKFRRFEFARPYSHWSRTFQNWLDRAAERTPRQAHERPHHDAKFDRKQANLARAFTAPGRVAGQRWEP